MIAVTSGVRDMQSVLNLVWDKLLPAMKPAPLATDDDARKTLERTLAGLALRPQEGSPSSGTAARVSGKTYLFPKNARKLQAIAFEAGGQGDEVTLVTRIDGVEQRITCGRGAWRKAKVAYGEFPEQRAAISGAWTGDDTYTVKICFYETPFTVTLGLKFSGETLDLDSRSNLGSGSTKQPRLVGKAESSSAPNHD